MSPRTLQKGHRAGAEACGQRLRARAVADIVLAADPAVWARHLAIALSLGVPFESGGRAPVKLRATALGAVERHHHFHLARDKSTEGGGSNYTAAQLSHCLSHKPL